MVLAPSPSTRSLGALPSIDRVRELSQSLAILDAVLSPEWEHRYYSFDSQWGSGEMTASMRNGSGDEYFILFDRNGAAIKGFDHEAHMSPWSSNGGKIWQGIYENLPESFSAFRNEVAFSMADVTFCIWREPSDLAWHCGAIAFPEGEDPDGSGWMLEALGGDPEVYLEFARDYYEIELPLSAIEAIYAHAPLSVELLRQLNPAVSLGAVAHDVSEIGYPGVAV